MTVPDPDYARYLLTWYFESRSFRKFLKTVIYRHTEARLAMDPSRPGPDRSRPDPRHPHLNRDEA